MYQMDIRRVSGNVVGTSSRKEPSGERNDRSGLPTSQSIHFYSLARDQRHSMALSVAQISILAIFTTLASFSLGETIGDLSRVLESLNGVKLQKRTKGLFCPAGQVLAVNFGDDRTLISHCSSIRPCGRGPARCVRREAVGGRCASRLSFLSFVRQTSAGAPANAHCCALDPLSDDPRPSQRCRRISLSFGQGSGRARGRGRRAKATTPLPREEEPSDYDAYLDSLLKPENRALTQPPLALPADFGDEDYFSDFDGLDGLDGLDGSDEEGTERGVFLRPRTRLRRQAEDRLASGGLFFYRPKGPVDPPRHFLRALSKTATGYDAVVCRIRCPGTKRRPRPTTLSPAPSLKEVRSDDFAESGLERFEVPADFAEFDRPLSSGLDEAAEAARFADEELRRRAALQQFLAQQRSRGPSASLKRSGGESSGGGGLFGGWWCFPSEATVETPAGAKRMDDLAVGDEVLALSPTGLRFSPVVWLHHASPNASVPAYLRVTTEDGRSLVLSGNHLLALLPRCPEEPLSQLSKGLGRHFRFASSARVGDCVLVREGRALVGSRVSSVEVIAGRGAWAPVTEEGNLIVDGVLASSYASVELHNALHSLHTALLRLSRLWERLSTALPFSSLLFSPFSHDTTSIPPLFRLALGLAHTVLPSV